ncbi:MAG TPA: FAD:protein FMN transferase [Candidatus Saccharimonadales bacterium]|nr:FAD:protein FMN transferase [Candidatus Saccharimonadales bacterium]
MHLQRVRTYFHAGGASIVLPILLLILSTVSCAGPRVAEEALERFEYEEAHMNLPFRIVLYAPTKAQADEAARAAFRRIEELNGIMSDYDLESELSHLSRSSGQGKVVAVSTDLWRVLERAAQLSAECGGAFDVTVGPYVKLWRKARRDHHLPEPERLERARRAVGYQKMKLDSARHSVELLVPDMRLDLGGIAKGYALDAALKVLQAHGIRRALVSGGGDMALGEAPPGKPGWRIELAPLDVTNAPPAKFVLLRNRGLATSGDLFQHVEIDGKRYSHIVDPRTGIGLTDHSLVTVIARDGMTADSLTKVVSVLGPEKGLNFIGKKTKAEARVSRQPGSSLEVVESPGFARFYAP